MMNRQMIPRIAAPLLVAAAILVSFRNRTVPAPIELAAADEPPRPMSEVQTAYATALGESAPGHVQGSSKATVTVLELSDFGCPYCARFATGTSLTLHKEFVATGQVRWKFMPFVLGMFPNGRQALRAAICAGEQSEAGYWRMHDTLFAKQSEWKNTSDPITLFNAYAAAQQLNAARFTKCYESPNTESQIAMANRLSDQLGVRATPTFFINGVRVEGALSASEFRVILREALGQIKVSGD